jgi:putative lipoprotein
MRAPLVSFLACTGVVVLAGCGDTGGDASTQPQGVLTGNVLYRERIALPPDARIDVRLEDVTRADAPADVLAEQTIAADGRQVPIPFELRYPPSRIEANHRYSVRASIRAPNGELMFTTTTRHAVLERGVADQNVTILLQRAGGATPQPEPEGPGANGAANDAGADGGARGGGNAGAAAAAPAAAGSLPGGTWWLVAIQRPGAAEEPITGSERHSIQFADGRLSGLGGCNRYTGGYQEPEPGKLKVSPMAATLMACPEPSIESEFLRAVGSATSYEVRGDKLLLSYGDGGVLTFARDEPTAATAPEVGRTFVYDCDGDLSFTVRTGPGELATVTFDGATLRGCGRFL